MGTEMKIISTIFSTLLIIIRLIDFRPWDFANFLRLQCHLSELPYPQWARKWINVRKEFSHFYSTRRCGNRLRMHKFVYLDHCSRYLGINNMLQNLGLTFEGRPHSGLDDANNIACIAVALIKVRTLTDDDLS